MADDATNDWFSEARATFGDRLAAAREAADLSQKQLARQIGVKTRTLAAWEDDLSEPRANRLQMLAGLLNVSLMWLLNGEGDGVAPPGDEVFSGGLDDVDALARGLEGIAISAHDAKALPDGLVLKLGDLHHDVLIA